MYLKRFSIIFFIFIILGSVVSLMILFPLRHINTIQTMAKKYGLSTAFICSVVHAESKFKQKAVSHKGASGLMQLTEPTANWLAEEIPLKDYSYNKIFNPEINIELGSYYLRKLIDRYSGDVDLALSAYNAGSGNVSKWLDNDVYSKDGESLDHIPFKETRNYIKRVNFNLKVYNVLLKLINKD